MFKWPAILIKNLILLVFIADFAHFADNITTTTTTSTILNDIQNAFKIITNNSRILNQVIPKMYKLPEIMKKSNALEFVFEVPNISNNNHGEKLSLIKMTRSDFMEPNFPNVSRYDMNLQMHKRQILQHLRKENEAHYVDNDDELSDETITIKEKQRLTSEQSSWTALGLEGWTGDIQPPLQKMKSIWILRDQHRHPSGNEEANVKKNFHKVNTNTSISIKYQRQRPLLPQQQQKQQQQELDANVYIARVNDPFGLSTKWQLKNPTGATKQSTLSTFLPKDERTKRDVFELYSMIKCSTGCDPLAYKGYGCYCGFLGAGTPVDDIDRCCKLHDKCYEYSNCLSYLEYFVPYVWKCYRGKPLCALDHGEWGGPTSCAALLCFCDMQLSQCLKKFTCPTRRAVCATSAARAIQNLFLL